MKKYHQRRNLSTNAKGRTQRDPLVSHHWPEEQKTNVTEKGGRVGLLYLTSVFSYNLNFTAALRALAKSSIIFQTQKFRYNNACLK